MFPFRDLRDHPLDIEPGEQEGYNRATDLNVYGARSALALNQIEATCSSNA